MIAARGAARPPAGTPRQETGIMLKTALVIAGTILLAIGAIGIVVPGLPTTTFLLIPAACYVRSCQRLYTWLINHRILG